MPHESRPADLEGGAPQRPADTGSRHPADRLSREAQAILDAPDQPRAAGPLTSAVAQRLRAEAAASRRPAIDAVQGQLGVTASTATVAGVDVVDLAPPKTTGTGRALYFHGGGFTGGLAHDMTAVLMADALGMPITSVDYALAPEAAFPVALDQAVEIYRALVAPDASNWVVFGVSAGGTIVLSLVQRLRELSLPMPTALGLFTPWTDLTGAGDSRSANDGRDPVLRWPEQLPVAAAAYAGDAALDDPLLSPAFATYDTTFPPSIITTGTRDLFLSDCTRLYWQLRRAGARTELRVWENLWHAFNTQPSVPEAAEARAEVAAFLRAELRSAAAPH